MALVKSVKTEIARIKRIYLLSNDKAFALWVGTVAFDLDEDDAHDAISIEGPNDKGIDLFWTDEVNRKVYICQCKYSESGSSNPKTKDLETLLGCTDWLVQSEETLKREGKEPLVGAALEFQTALDNQYAVYLWFVYFGKRSEGIDKRIRVYNSVPENLDKKWIAVNCSNDVLKTLYDENQGLSKRIEKAIFDFPKKKLAETYFEFSGEFGSGVVTTIDGQELAKLYKQYGDNLFARNIRGFLGERSGTVNYLLKQTALDKSARGNFWAYNNGITIVCNDYKISEKNNKIEVKEFSIVNGGQTTVILSKNSSEYGVEEIFVLARIIKPPQIIINDIIKFTNTQNQIRSWDFSSQDPIQIRLKSDFSGLTAPYYYDIRRGEWGPLAQSEKQLYQRKDRTYRKIKHDLLAQYLASYKGNTVVAYKNKGFLAERFRTDTFPPDLRVEEALFIWLAGEEVKEVVRGETRIEREKIDEGEKEREKFLYLLVRGGRFYSLGVFGLLANYRNGIDYLRSINEDRIVSNNANARLHNYAKLSTLFYKRAAVDEMKVSGTDISVLVRESDYFKRIAERIHSYYEEISVDDDYLNKTLPKLK